MLSHDDEEPTMNDDDDSYDMSSATENVERLAITEVLEPADAPAPAVAPRFKFSELSLEPIAITVPGSDVRHPFEAMRLVVRVHRPSGTATALLTRRLIAKE